ncbi:MAG: hypothetical protein H9535_16710 [Ignavibacteria bacterium]|nr:hypothetical protein [Ignavibacteria bacterium]
MKAAKHDWNKLIGAQKIIQRPTLVVRSQPNFPWILDWAMNYEITWKMKIAKGCLVRRRNSFGIHLKLSSL